MTPEQLLFARFVSRDDAYAEQQPNGDYHPVREPLTPGVLRRHLDDRLCVGVYQLKGSQVKWLCLDVDGAHENPDHAREAVLALVQTCRHFSLMPYVERSGAKGWHLWIFFSHLVEAKVAQAVGRGIVAETGEENLAGTSEVAVFPKQIHVNEGGFGNLVKLPWAKRRDNGKRGVFVDAYTLEKLTQLEQEALLLGAVLHTGKELQDLIEENGWEVREAREPQPEPPSQNGLLRRQGYRGDLPCYEFVADVDSEAVIPNGHRNNVLFAFTSQQKRKGSVERVALREILALNRDRCRPPLPDADVRKLVESCYRSDDSAACCDIVKAAQLCPVLLHGEACPIFEREQQKREQRREALNKDEDRLTITPLRVMRTSPPIYTATVRGRELPLTLDELTTFRFFKKRCVEVLDFVPELPVVPCEDDSKRMKAPGKVWDEMVNEALKSVIEDEAPPEDASPRGVVWAEIRAFLTEGALGENRDDVKRGMVVIDTVGEEQFYLFRGDDLRRRLKLLRVDELPMGQVWKLIHDRGGKNGTVTTPTHGPVRVWQIPVAVVRGEAGASENAPAFSSPPRGLLD